MCEYIIHTMFQIPIALTDIARHESSYKIHSQRVQSGRERNGLDTQRDFLVQFDRVGVFGVERWVSCEHFEYEDAECVPIDAFVVGR